MRTHPPIFARIASTYPRSSPVIELARDIADAENPGWRERRRRSEIQRLWDLHRLPRFLNYRPNEGNDS